MRDPEEDVPPIIVLPGGEYICEHCGEGADVAVFGQISRRRLNLCFSCLDRYYDSKREKLIFEG